MSKYKYYLMVFMGGCSYGVVSTFIKLAYAHGYGLKEITALQFITGAALLWAAALFVKKVNLTAKQFLSLLLKGIPLAMTGIFYNFALQHINASLGIILLLQFTWISFVIRYLFDGSKPAKMHIAAAAVILAGSAAASGVLQNGAVFSVKGVIFGLLAAVSFASFLYFSGQNNFEIHPIHKSAVITTGAAVLVLTVMPPVFLFNGAGFAGVMPYVFCAAFFGTFLSTILFNTGMPKSNGYGSILSASEMPMVIIMSTVVLHEHVGLLQWLGVLIILAGIALPSVEPHKIKQLFKKEERGAELWATPEK